MAAEGVKGRLTAKVGPLPVWGWAVVLLVAYFAYQHFHSSSGGTASQGSTGQPDPNAANPVPGFDAASEVGGGGSGFGTPSPDTITNNYYYGTTAGAQATGGGTSSGTGGTTATATPTPTPSHPLDVIVPPNIPSAPAPATSPTRATTGFTPSPLAPSSVTLTGIGKVPITPSRGVTSPKLPPTRTFLR